MRRVFIGSVVGLAVVVGLMLNMQRVAAADQAIVIKNDGECGMLGADENGDQAFGGLGELALVLENDNKVMMKCKGTGLVNLSGRAQVFEGFSCGILKANDDVVVTEDTHATVAAKGMGTMTCTYDKSDLQ
jgi:hypothetical protein